MARKILVAEDDANINEVVCEYLKDAGFGPVSAPDGGAAMDVINSTSDISLFILDIMLPGALGLDLLRAIRGSRVYAKAPVLMLTALADERTQLASYNARTDDFVAKPFSPRILIKRVEALLIRCGGGQGVDTDLAMGGVRVDTNSYEAYENGRRIDLTLKELELLKVLMQNAQRPLSRQQLLDLVWGYDYFGDERVVDAHIKNLRKKLSCSLIQTVKGVGYKADIAQGADI